MNIIRPNASQLLFHNFGGQIENARSAVGRSALELVSQRIKELKSFCRRSQAKLLTVVRRVFLKQVTEVYERGVAGDKEFLEDYMIVTRSQSNAFNSGQ